MTHPDTPADFPRPDDAAPDAVPNVAPNVVPNVTPNAAADAAADVPFDAELRAAARHYHAPPPSVPAEAMWAAIQARRAQARSAAAPHDLPLAGAVAPPEAPAVRVAHVPRRGGRVRPASRWAPLAAAAVLLLGVGIGVGRYTATPDPSVATDGTPTQRTATASLPAASLPAASIPAASTPVGHAPGEGTRIARGLGGAAGPARSAPPVASARGTSAAGASAAPVAVAAAPITTQRAAGDDRLTPPGAPADGASTPLRAATEQHLARAEALLTTFAAHDLPDGARNGRTADTPDAAWARDLLSTTRLLLDSPAGREPSRRALLEDLELVLDQIARLPRADTPEERALIDRAIRRGDLMAKLRTAVPAGAPAAALTRGS